MAERKKSTPAVKAKSTGKKKKKAVAKSTASSKKTTAVKAKETVKKKTATKAKSRSKKKAAASKKTTQKSSVDKKELNGSKILISGDERHRMICEAAYLVSLKQDPHACNPEMDWVHAETVIDMIFKVG